jgi:hypothetical protein
VSLDDDGIQQIALIGVWRSSVKPLQSRNRVLGKNGETRAKLGAICASLLRLLFALRKDNAVLSKRYAT